MRSPGTGWLVAPKKVSTNRAACCSGRCNTSNSASACRAGREVSATAPAGVINLTRPATAPQTAQLNLASPPPVSGEAVSTVDHQVRTGHVAGSGTGQVEVQAGEFLGAANASHRNFRLPQPVVFREGLDELGEDVAGADAVDPDVVLRKLD